MKTLKNRPSHRGFAFGENVERDFAYARDCILWFEGLEKERREENTELKEDVDIDRSEEELIKENTPYGLQAIFDAGSCNGVYEKNKEFLGE